MRFFMFLAAVLLCSLTTGCTKTPTWTLFYYSGQQTPPSDDHYEAIQGYYDTLEQCKKKAEGIEYLSETPSVYQCGFQCKLDDHDMVKCDQWHTFTPKQP
ncbi:hypothetical protein [Shewanella mangrovi]|uniref:hypothetical protein n=1 Tax=Shewanella mangrovi TaxID=1515746 RepID=UPI00055CA399|nr:hypothetical protein [Shewanella mangrovi]